MKRFALGVLVLYIGCGPSVRGDDDDDDGNGDGGSSVCPRCTPDNTGYVDCEGNLYDCPIDMACGNGVCADPCLAAERNHSSIGCDYYGVDMDAAMGPPQDACYTMFVANVSRAPAHMNMEWNGQTIDLGRWAKIPSGNGQSLTYGAYDPVAGLAPGQVAVIFLAYAPGFGNVACPAAVGGAAIGTEAQLSGPGFGSAFHLTTDQPVTAYQMLPYGGGAAAATGATLLLPTSAWGTNYVAVSAYDQPAPPIPIAMGPSYNIVAKEDATQVTIRPTAAIAGGGGLPAGPAGMPYTFMLNKGQHAQITQANPLSGSPIEANKPIGVFGGHQIMSIDRCCGDHGEQMLAPVRALGSEYVAAPHPDRKPSGMADPRVYRIIGAVDGTQLTYEPANAGPATVDLGQLHEIRTSGSFVVRSQDADHPFLMFTYMTGAGEQGEGGWGDPDFVRLVPPLQYLSHYVFFTDPTYPFTVLTVVRKKQDGAFADVTLDCLGGPILGWSPVGTAGDFEITYVRLVDHFQGQNGCNNGVRVMDSTAPFGVWVWGWGSEDTSTGWVSYGYPAGEAVLPINDVVVGREPGEPFLPIEPYVSESSGGSMSSR